jgi:hypothetical protein
MTQTLLEAFGVTQPVGRTLCRKKGAYRESFSDGGKKVTTQADTPTAPAGKGHGVALTSSE